MSQSESNSNQSNRSREVAVRLFAEELDQINHIYKESDDEYAPNYGLLPTGDRANRVFVAGTVTEVEDVGDDSEYWRAKVNDSTGTVMVYAGDYQPEAAAAIKNLETPAYVSIVGKVQSFSSDEDEDDDMLVYVQPEEVVTIDKKHRDRWVLETARKTLDRLEDGPVNEDIATLLEEQYGDGLEDAQDQVREAAIRALENYDGQTDE